MATLLGLLYTTGLRIGEALALDVGDWTAVMASDCQKGEVWQKPCPSSAQVDGRSADSLM